MACRSSACIGVRIRSVERAGPRSGQETKASGATDAPTPLELVEAALAGTGWKSAGLALEARPPDAACARAIMAAYRSGRCEAWMAAWLLGANGHPDGYATALAILQSGAGKGSESYAGIAL